MICHVCRGNAIGQCKSCGKFYCSAHGDYYCVQCAKAITPSHGQKDAGFNIEPSEQISLDPAEAGKDAGYVESACSRCGKLASGRCSRCGRSYCSNHGRRIALLARAFCNGCYGDMRRWYVETLIGVILILLYFLVILLIERLS